MKLEDGETPKEAIDRVYKKEDKQEDFEKGSKSTTKDEDRHQKVRDLEDKAYKEFKTMYDNYIDKDGMEGWGGIPASQMDKAVEKFNKKYKEEFDKLESDRFVSFEDFAKRENNQSETKALETKTNLEEKENAYKKVLKRYKENDRKRWSSGLSNEEYHKAWEEAKKAKKELTTARRE